MFAISIYNIFLLLLLLFQRVDTYKRYYNIGMCVDLPIAQAIRYVCEWTLSKKL